jgi:peptidoglycan/xylan/chitin deacetylase (PgdA/CDA1 family)
VKKLNNNILPKHCIVFYHYIRDSSQYNLHILSIEKFKQQVDFLLQYLQPLDPEELLSDLTNQKKIKEGFLLTFDDGLIEHYTVVYKYLKSKGIRGIFFPNIMIYKKSKVPLANQLQVLIGYMGYQQLTELIINTLTENFPQFKYREIPKASFYIKRMDKNKINDLKYFLNFTLPWEVSQEIIDSIFSKYISSNGSFIKENFLSLKQIKEMSDNGMIFGGHTVTHCYLTKCSSDIKKKEILESINFIKDITGKNSYFFCYPYGHYDNECIQILKNSEVKVAFTTAPEDNLSYENRFFVGRYDTVLLPPVSKFNLTELNFIKC